MSTAKFNYDDPSKLFSDRSFELFLEKYLKDQDIAVPDLQFLKQIGLGSLFGNAQSNWVFFDRPHLLVQAIITEYQRTIGSEDNIIDYEKNKVTATNRLAGQSAWTPASYFALRSAIGRTTRNDAGNLTGAAYIMASAHETAFLLKNISLVGKPDEIEKSFDGRTNSILATATIKAKQEAQLMTLKEYKVAMAYAKGNAIGSVALVGFVAVGNGGASALSPFILRKRDLAIQDLRSFGAINRFTGSTIGLISVAPDALVYFNLIRPLSKTFDNGLRIAGGVGLALRVGASGLSIGLSIFTLATMGEKLTPLQRVAHGLEIGIQALYIALNVASYGLFTAGLIAMPVAAGLAFVGLWLAALNPIGFATGLAMLETANKIRAISNDYRRYNFGAYSHLADYYQTHGSLLISGTIATLSVVGILWGVFGFLFYQSIIEAKADSARRSILSEYGSFANMWARSYDVEAMMLVDQSDFQAATREFTEYLADLGTERYVQLFGFGSNALQRGLAGFIREGGSLPPTQFYAYVSSMKNRAYNAELTKTIVNMQSGSIDLTTTAASQYVTSVGPMITPSYQQGQRVKTGKNSYSSTITYSPAQWSFTDGDTKTTVNLRMLSGQSFDNDSSSPRAMLSMGGGDDTIIAGTRHFTADGGTGFNGVDYSSAYDSGSVTVKQLADGSLVVDKSGYGDWNREEIRTETSSYGKRSETIQYTAALTYKSNSSGVDILTNTQWIKGTSGADSFFGSTANNFFVASLGNDTYEGAGGSDWLDYSTLTPDSQGSAALGIVASLASGTVRNNQVPAGSGQAFVHTVRTINNIRGSDGSDQIIGNEFDNVIAGGTGGDTLRGGLGNDTFLLDVNGSGLVDGGEGIDTADLSALAANSSMTLDEFEATSFTLINGTGTFQGYTFINIENTRTGAGRDKMIGSVTTNLLDGGKGADWIDGGGGGDDLMTGFGEDTVFGGEGDDAIYVQHEKAAGDARYYIDAKIIDGGVGLDVVDYRYVGEDMSVGIYASLQDGQVKTCLMDGVLSSKSVIDNIVNVENVAGTDYGDQLYGDTNDNRLLGFDGNDWLSGAGGKDTLITGKGKDSVWGGSGNDFISIQHQQAEGGKSYFVDLKFIDGEADFDIVDYRSSGAPAGVGIDASLFSGQVKTWLQNSLASSQSVTDTLLNIEGLGGTDAADRLLGNDVDNQLDGYAGNDLIDAGAGADTILTGAGKDTVFGGAGDDTVNVQHQQVVAKGRYLLIRKNDGVNDHLSIAEVQVISGGVNVALNKTVSSSGSLDAAQNKVANLVDGKSGGNMVEDGVYTSSAKGGAWVQIDLGSTLEIEQINVFGRTDASASQNGNYTVYVGNSDLSAKTTAEIEAMSGVCWSRQVGRVDQERIDALQGWVSYFADAKTINGGDGSDTVDYRGSGAPTGVGIDGSLVSGQIKTWLRNGTANSQSVTDTLMGIENLGGTDAADRLQGNDGDNQLAGNAGDDWIDGGAGADAIFTGTGKDVVLAGAGQDTVYVKHQQMAARGRYLLICKNSGVNDYLSIAEVQVISGGVNVALNKTVSSSGSLDAAKAANLVDGKTGGDAAAHGIYTSSAKGGAWVQIDLGSTLEIDQIKVYGRTDASASQNGDYTVYVSDSDLSAKTTAEIEAMSGVSWSRQVGRLDQVVIETMQGRGSYFADAKTINGGDGSDMVEYRLGAAPTGVGIDGSLVSGQVKTWLQNSVVGSQSVIDTLVSVEGLGGTDAADRLLGNDGDNQLAGHGGDDLIDGGAGVDTVFTGVGKDTVLGGAGDDAVYMQHQQIAARGRYLLIRKNSGVNDHLSIAEVQVISGGVNVALNKAVSSSGSLDADLNKAANLVDGNSDGKVGVDGVYTSNAKGGAWVQIDLGSALEIEQINIYGRTDANASQNGDYTVYVSDSDLSAKTTAEIEAMSGVSWSRQAGPADEVEIKTMQGRGSYFADAKTIDGGDGSDTVDYRIGAAPTGVGIDGSLVSGQVKTWLQNSVVGSQSVIDTLVSIENLGGTDAADKLLGNDGDNQMAGHAGDDSIDGGAGADTILTGKGKDTVLGGAGDDMVRVQHQQIAARGRYLLIRQNSGVNDYLSIAEVQVISGGVNVALNKTVSSSGSLDTGLNKAANLVDGKSGGAVGVDGVYTSSAKGGAWVQIDLGSALEIEQIKVYGRTDASAPQNGNYTVYVSDSDLSAKTTAEIEAMSGVSWSRQDGRVDQVVIETMQGRGSYFADAKTINGGDGSDTVDYRSSGAPNGVGIDASLVSGQVKTWLQNSVVGSQSVIDTLVSIESLGGTDSADKLLGNDGDNQLAGHGGDDLIDGGAGADTVFTGVGKDTVLGGAGDDMVRAQHQQIAARGRYLLIRQDSGVNDYLSIAEVQVISGGVNVALNKTVSSSGSLDADLNKAANLVDGKTAGNAAADGVYTSGAKGGAWVQIDLGSALEIEQINIYGRTDANASQSGNYTVYVSDSDLSAKTTAEIEAMSGVSWSRQAGPADEVEIKTMQGRGSYFADAKTIDGGDGSDTVDYRSSGAPNGVGIDGSLVSGQVKTWLQNSVVGSQSVIDTLVSIENLGGTDAADKLLGNDGDNQLAGHGGDDLIDGGAGVDTVFTGVGKDTVLGGAGDDALYMQHQQIAARGRYLLIRKNSGVNDHLSIAEVQVISGGVNVALNKTVSSSGSLDADLNKAANLVDGKTGGNAAADGVYTSNAKGGAWVQIDLGSALEIEQINIYGRTDASAPQNGDYTVYVSDSDLSAKTASEIEATSGVSWSRQDGRVDQVGIETMQGRGSYFADAKTINGGDGSDTVDYRSNGAPNGVGIDASLASGQVKTWLQNSVVGSQSVIDTLVSIESLGGTDSADKLMGSDGDNQLTGYGGDDSIDGGAGADTILTGMGKDTVLGGAGDDTIYMQHQQIAARGRYLLIRKNDGVNEHLSIAEVQVISGGVNVALNKTVSSSGSLDAAKAANLVDGKTGGNAAADGIYTSSAKGGAWVQIDLGSALEIELINVYGRTDANASQNGDYTVYVSDSDLSAKTASEIEATSGVSWSRQAGRVDQAIVDMMQGRGSYFADTKAIDGGGGFDEVLYVYGGSPEGVGIDGSLVSGQVKTWLQNSVVGSQSVIDTLVSVEGLGGTDAADKLQGNNSDNRLTGFGGDDSIDAGAGADIILTGWGKDTVLAGDGDDTVHVQHQQVAQAAKGRYVMIRKNSGANDYLSIAEVQVISAGVNVALGKAVSSSGSFGATSSTASRYRAANVVDGRTGGSMSRDGIYMSSTRAGGWLQIDLGASVDIDQINLFGRSDTSLTQNGNYTVYVTNTDMSKLLSAEIEAMTGSTWSRRIGNERNVSLAMGFFSDAKTINGGDGKDTVDYRSRSAADGVGIDASLLTGQVNTWLENGVVNAQSVADVLTNIENIGGTNSSDRLVGDNSANSIAGFGGNDSIDGAGGDDTLFTGTGKDTITGGAGNDSIFADQEMAALVGRYVLVRHSPTAVAQLGLGELEVWSGGVNVARNSAVKVIESADGSLAAYSGRNLIDGVSTDASSYLSVSNSGNSWVMLDLGQSYQIDKINLTASNVVANASSDIGIFVSDSSLSDIGNKYGALTARSGVTYAELTKFSQFDLGIERFLNSKVIDGGEGEDFVSYHQSQGAKGVGIYGSLVSNQVFTWYEAGSVKAGSSVDTLSNIENLGGTDVNDFLLGNSGNNKLVAFDGNDVINGGAGSDTLAGGAGSDTYRFSAGFGTDAVYETDEPNSTDVDVLSFEQSIDYSKIWMSKNGDNLLIRLMDSATSDSVTVLDWYHQSKPRKVARIEASGYVIEGAAKIEAFVSQLSAFGAPSSVGMLSTSSQAKIYSTMADYWVARPK